MNLVYDLRYATDHFPGIGTYAYSLAEELLARGRVGEITLLWDPRARDTRFDAVRLRAAPRARWLDVDVPALSAATARGTGRILSRLGADAYLSPFWLRPEGTRVPCVLTLHDVIPLAIPETMSFARRLAFRWAMQRAAGAAAVLTVSRFSRDDILRRTPIPERRLHLVHNGVIPASGRTRRPDHAPDAPFALIVGANREHKGHKLLAAAWREFAGVAPLELVGAGALLPGKYSLADAARSMPGIHALGQVSPEELEWLYVHAALVLVPSRYEGFGQPLLEAAARGTPVIASDIPAFRETGEGVARFVSAPTGEAWARAIAELAADDAARGRMRAAGLVRAAEYTFSACAERVEVVLRSVARARGPVPA
jgi:glycosyltransferase involved in cell wall biosynthesis